MHVHLTPTALAKAKALGVVAAALTAGGAGGMIALSQVSNSASSTTVVSSADTSTPPSVDPTATATPTPTPTETESAQDAAKTAPSASSYTLPPCPAGVKNHGAYVSGVAHSAPKGKDGEHGSWVSQAAHSDCGKPAADASGKPEAPDSHGQETESPETHSPKPEHTGVTETQAPKPDKTVEEGGSVAGTGSAKHGNGDSHH